MVKRFIITLHNNKSTTLLERRITLVNSPEVEAEEVEVVVAVASICMHSSILHFVVVVERRVG